MTYGNYQTVYLFFLTSYSLPASSQDSIETFWLAQSHNKKNDKTQKRPCLHIKLFTTNLKASAL